MYNYQEEKQNLLTDEGQRMFLSVRDRVKELLCEAGAFKSTNALSKETGSSWTMLACVDRLEELGEIKEVTAGQNVLTQNRVYIKR